VEIKFRIKPKGGTEDIVTAELVDVIAWEENFQRPSSALSGDDVFARDYVWLAWHTYHRIGKTTLDFMDWVATLEDIEGQPEDALVPLESPALTGSSPDSA
jgi:hypothetical protein